MKNKFLIIGILILLLGVVFRLVLTSNGNFLFNMDNARDFVDIREMIEQHKLRLTGPTSAIEGLYNGPLWYYLLSVPYILTHGDPYGAIIMQIVLWVIGGISLLMLIKSFSKWLIIPLGLVWVGSNYIVLTNFYSFNPNPVTLLFPLFVYSLVKYIKDKKGLWIILVWFLAGAFFNFEMSAGIWTPFIIFVSIFTQDKKLFKDKFFWFGLIIFVLLLMPQFLFDLRHQFIMSKSVIKYLSENTGSGSNILLRFQSIASSFYNVFQATMMNQKLLSIALLILIASAFRIFVKSKKDIVVSVAGISILVPFFGYLFVPVSVSPWHLGGFAATSLIIIAFALSTIWKTNIHGKLITLILSFFLILFSSLNVINFFLHDLGKPSMDPSLYKNEIAAIDYVYRYADGKNFKVYTYLPSVYDYPYQYLFWWYGKKTYGYVPGEYRYLPNKPKYIPSQDRFDGKKDNFSDLIFLIKEPNHNYTRFGWEGSFINLEFIGKEMVGPIEIEIRKE